MNKIALVTGASSGIGAMTARELAGNGFTVYVAARRMDKMEELKKDGIRPIMLDLTDEESVVKCVHHILEETGRIDVLVNNAGYGSYGVIEDVPMEEARRQFDVNLFGMARLIQLVTPSMRKHREGKIVNISSMGGKIWTKFGGWYHATKFAVEGFSDCLRMELAPFGIDVVVVEPGGIKTDWGIIAAEHLKDSAKGGTYEKYANEAADGMIKNYSGTMLATAENIEAISPPVFGAYCSANARECIQRIAQYKALAGAIQFEVTENEAGITVEIKGEDGIELPEIIIGIEMVLLVNLIRRATKEHIVPAKVTARRLFTNPSYEEFLGCRAQPAEKDSITLCRKDAEIPFITRNESMWNFFEPELKRRLGEMESDDSFSAKVRSVLVELIPAGKSSVEDVAVSLGLSKRSLQRKLKEEDPTFQKQLNHTRELLAKNYLQNTRLSSEDIAYLLGY